MIIINNCTYNCKKHTMNGACVRYHLLVKSEGGDGVDHIEVPAVPRCAGFSGRRDCPLPAPEVRGHTETSQKVALKGNNDGLFRCLFAFSVFTFCCYREQVFYL